MTKGGDPLKPHEAVQAADGWWYCKCGFREERPYTKHGIDVHVARALQKKAKLEAQRRQKK